MPLAGFGAGCAGASPIASRNRLSNCREKSALAGRASSIRSSREMVSTSIGSISGLTGWIDWASPPVTTASQWRPMRFDSDGGLSLHMARFLCGVDAGQRPELNKCPVLRRPDRHVTLVQNAGDLLIREALQPKLHDLSLQIGQFAQKRSDVK